MQYNKSWVEDNLPGIECTLDWSSKNNFLNYEGKPLVFHRIDKAVLLIEKALIKNSKSGAIVYPVNQSGIVVPMCLEALYSTMSNKDGKRKILLISGNPEIREVYRKTMIRDTALNEIFPLGIVKSDGAIKPQLRVLGTKISDIDCKFLHTSTPDLLPQDSITSQVGCIIIDVSDMKPFHINKIIKWSQLHEINSVIFLETNPCSIGISALKNNNIPIWGWNTQSLLNDFSEYKSIMKDSISQYENPVSDSIYGIINTMNGVKTRFIELNDDGITNILMKMTKVCFEMKTLVEERDNGVLKNACRLYSNCKFSFERMCAPLADIESECKESFLSKSLEDRIRTLRNWKATLNRIDLSFGDFWDTTYSLADFLYEKFESDGNPKYEKLKELVKTLVNERKRILIFCYSRPYARALTNALSRDISVKKDELEQMGVVITSIQDVRHKSNFDVTIILNQMPVRYMWLFNSSYSKEIIFISYKSEKFLARYNINKEESVLAKLLSRNNNVNFLQALKSPQSQSIIPFTAESSFKVFNWSFETENRDEIKVVPDEEDFDDEIEEIDDELTQMEIMTTPGGKCTKFVFEDGRIMYSAIKAHPILTADGYLRYSLTSKIKPGDYMIIVNNLAKLNIIQKIHEKVYDSKHVKELAWWAGMWKRVIQTEMLLNQDNPGSLYYKIEKVCTEKGIPTPTKKRVKEWACGIGMTASDEEYIKIISDVYPNKELAKSYKKVIDSIDELEDIRKETAEELDTMIIQHGVDYLLGEDENKIVNERFNLTIKDFANVVSILKIRSVEDGNEKRGSLRMGRVIANENQ